MKKMIRLRPLQRSDLESIHRMYADEETAKYMRSGAHTELKQTVQLMEHYFEDGNLAYALVDEQEAFAGYTALVKSKEESRTYSLSIMINPDFQGQGCGSAGIRGILELAADHKEIRVITAYILEQNTPSRKLVEKCGFSLLKTLEFEDGNRLGVYLYEM